MTPVGVSEILDGFERQSELRVVQVLHVLGLDVGAVRLVQLDGKVVPRRSKVPKRLLPAFGPGAHEIDSESGKGLGRRTTRRILHPVASRLAMASTRRQKL